MARHTQVTSRFKSARRKDGAAACEACGWKPPDGLREAGQRDGHKIMHAHHVVPLACGGPDVSVNLVLLCPNCHALAHRLGRMTLTGAYPEYAWAGAATRDELLAELRMIENEPDRWSERMKRQRAEEAAAARAARIAEEEKAAKPRRELIAVLISGLDAPNVLPAARKHLKGRHSGGR